jgi:hypothetical protein
MSMSPSGRTAGITDAMIADQFRWLDPERAVLFGSSGKDG